MVRRIGLASLSGLLILALYWTAVSAQAQPIDQLQHTFEADGSARIQPAYATLFGAWFDRMISSDTTGWSSYMFSRLELLLGMVMGSNDQAASVDTASHHKEGRVYLIRHGEKGSGVGLSSDGYKRASCLADLFTLQESTADASLSSLLDEEKQQQSFVHLRPESSSTTTRRRHHPIPVSYLLSQSFRPDGRRSRPFQTLVPLANKLKLGINHECDREDAKCAKHLIESHAAKGHNVLVSWQHTALGDVAEALGVEGLVYPKSRYDILYEIHRGRVRAITSEECEGLDAKHYNWHGTKHTRIDGRKLVDDGAWETGFGDEDL